MRRTQRPIFCRQFLRQADSYLNPLYEPSPFVVTAEGADRVDDPVHLAQLHAVHPLVQFVEVRLDLGTVHGVDFVVGFIEQSQGGRTVAEVGRILRK